MKNVPLVSVIIPTYNRASKVGIAIESVLKQTYPNVQLIVADDGSTDLTVEVVKNYPSIQYIPLAHGGQAWARNQGLQYASGEYIASLDSDDIWDVLFLEKCISTIQRHDLDFVFTNWMQDLGNEQFADRFSMCTVLANTLKESDNQCIVLEDKKLRRLYLTGCPSPSSSLVIKRSSIVNVWNADLNIADDWCLVMDMVFNKPCKAALLRQVLWTKKMDGQNIYDGHDFIDVVNKLWVYDTALLFVRFKHRWSPKEIKIFKRQQAFYLVLYSYYQLRFYKQFRDCLHSLQKAISINAEVAFVSVFKQLIKATNIF